MARRSLALLQQQQHCRYHDPFIGAEADPDLLAFLLGAIYYAPRKISN